MCRKIDYKELGNKIRLQREYLGMSREKFSELLDISSFYVGQIERGERKMSIEILINISKCLHVSLDYLVFGNDEEAHEDTDTLKLLIDKCSVREKRLIEDIIRVILPHIGNENL